MKESITFITGNQSKVEAASRYLHSSIISKNLDLIEIQSLDLEEVVTHKVQEAYNAINRPVLIEDVSLTFNVLGKLPGPLIKWFYEELGNEGLCRLLDGYDDRSATATVMYGLHDGNIISLFDGFMQGRIAESPRGKWFAWSPIFIPNGYDETWGEMSDELLHETSMRRIALTKLNTYLGK